MASQVSTGSPKANRRQTPLTKNPADGVDDNKTPRNVARTVGSKSITPASVRPDRISVASAKQDTRKFSDPTSDVNNILAQLRVNDARQPLPTHGKQQDHLDKVIANLKDQHKTLRKQQMELKDDSDIGSYRDPDRSSGSELFTPATETFDLEQDDKKQNIPNHAEMNRIKQELEAAKSVINQQEMELAETRNLRHTMEQAMGPASEADYPLHAESPHVPNSHIQGGFNVTARPFTSRAETTWQMVDGGKVDLAATLVNNSIGRGRQWNHGQPALVSNAHHGLPYPPTREVRANSLGYGTHYAPQVSPADVHYPQNRTFSSGSSNISYGIDDRLFNHAAPNAGYTGNRRQGNQVRTTSTISDPLSPITPVSPYGQTLVDTGAFTSTAGPGHFGYHDRGFGGQTSPVATQFPGVAGQVFPGDIGIAVSASLQQPVSSKNKQGNGFNQQNYVVPAEPMNYRRLLDKSVSCDWKYIVDKIVCNNDQQASIFLQQKLKVGTAEQKYEIVESIVNQAYPLMINRFGNFLVQRCFEHGTPEQVVAIADAIHGNVISLSMDPFGCHVIQKAFDSVPEEHKADMVRELLRRIPDTVIHRYACHVWQKLFELRWSGEPPQIMVKVNEALRGMWHEVALGETGSLVVQNIFENCVEEEKRPAIEEVISNIDLIAHGQFGNWCIQHLCEHGSPPDKRRVIDHILQNSYNYSIDQFASKVVEKCLKIGGPEFLDRYLGVITTARPERPRIPLIDIAGDQYGNYLVQWILVNTHQHQREQVAIHIRKHMVSLRGSKFGSRVAMLCSNPASVTRPGAGSALVNPYGAPAQQRLGGRYR